MIEWSERKAYWRHTKVQMLTSLLPFILAMIIGPALENAFRWSLMRSAGSFTIFFKSPISTTLIALSCLLFIWNIYRTVRPKKAWESALEAES